MISLVNCGQGGSPDRRLFHGSREQSDLIRGLEYVTILKEAIFLICSTQNQCVMNNDLLKLLDDKHWLANIMHSCIFVTHNNNIDVKDYACAETSQQVCVFTWILTNWYDLPVASRRHQELTLMRYSREAAKEWKLSKSYISRACRMQPIE